MMKMLIIEPDPTDRFILQKSLESRFDFMFFESIREIPEYAPNHHFDIALINVHLHDFWDGLAAVKLLKTLTKNKFTAIALTHDIDIPSTTKILAADFDIIISLPMIVESFDEILKNKTS